MYVRNFTTTLHRLDIIIVSLMLVLLMLAHVTSNAAENILAFCIVPLIRLRRIVVVSGKQLTVA